jgi:hypothetical protein
MSDPRPPMRAYEVPALALTSRAQSKNLAKGVRKMGRGV